MTELAVETVGLCRRFGELNAVDNVNLRVDAGQFFGFLGPNGAGKSTTIKMLTGLLEPTAGRIRILGLDLQSNPVEVKSQIGVVPEGLALFDRLTGPEYLIFAGRMYGLDRVTAAERAQELLDFMGLADRAKTLIVDYSHGMKKKLAMAAAVIHGPKVLFLDEPFEGVDAIAAGTLKAMLNRMIARGATIFLTSHVLEIVERLCSHVAIIHRGGLVAQGSIEELRSGVAARHDDGQKLSLEQNLSRDRGWRADRRAGTFVAGVTLLPGKQEQLLLVAWLRWRLFVNSLRTDRSKFDLAAKVIGGISICGLVLVFGPLLGLGSWYAISSGKPMLLLGEIWLVFLGWLLVPLIISGFGADSDPISLLRFPLRYSTFVFSGLGRMESLIPWPLRRCTCCWRCSLALPWHRPGCCCGPFRPWQRSRSSICC